MKRYIQICSMCLIFVFYFSCKGQADLAKNSINQAENERLDTTSTITDFKIIITPNAPNRITRNIKLDKDGNLLFASYDKIIRYDRNSFTNFTKGIGLDTCDAFDVLEDSRGNIWIASTHLGAFLINPSSKLESGQKAITQFTPKEGLAHIRTMCLYEDRAGGIWIGTENGISYWDGRLPDEPVSFRNLTAAEGLTSNDINTIMQDQAGRIWIGTRGTVCVYDPSTSKGAAEIKFTEFTDDKDKAFENVWSIIEDQKGNIWLGGQYGLWSFKGNIFNNYTSTSVTGVFEDQKGNIWFTHRTTGPHQAGLSLYDEKSLGSKNPKATQIHNGDGMFFGIAEDKEGSIWVGKLDGVFRYDPYPSNVGTQEKSVTYFKVKQAKD